MCLRHARELVEEDEEELAMREFRKFLVRYSKGMPYSSRLRGHLPELSSLERLRIALDEMMQSASRAEDAATRRQGDRAT